MKFGVSLPGRGPLATPDSILQLATKADALGFDSLFVTDHVVLPASMARSVYPYSSSGQLPGGAAQDYLEPLAVLGWLAHVTKRIRIGTRSAIHTTHAGLLRFASTVDPLMITSSSHHQLRQSVTT